MNFKLVRVGAEKSFWESEWGTRVSGLVEGLYVTRVISMVTDQHGSNDSFKPRASGSHEKRGILIANEEVDEHALAL